MKRLKFEFRNRSLAEQIDICERTVNSLAVQPAEHLQQVDVPGLQAVVSDTRASHDRIALLRAELTTEISRRKTLVRESRNRTIAATNMVAVNMHSDPARMLVTGLSLVGRGQPIGRAAAPQNLRASPTDEEGEARLRWRRSVRECTFQIEYRLDGETDDWRRAASCTRQTCVVKGLLSGRKYWFRVRAVNAHGEGVWSNEAPVRVK